MSPAYFAARNPSGPPRPIGAGLTMQELADGLRVMAGMPPSTATCGVCGGPLPCGPALGDALRPGLAARATALIFLHA